MAHIEAEIEITCCALVLNLSNSADVEPSAGGRELGTAVCHKCGSEYMLGLITRTRVQSVASEKFDTVEDAVLAAVGVDTEDFDAPDDPDVRMCARCDGRVEGAIDYCTGCREYVCIECRERVPRNQHQVDEHWQSPKFAEVVTLSGEDDGSVLTGDDAIFTAESES